MYYDLTKGKISRFLVLFALPMIAGLPIGWGLADVTGIWYMKKAVRQKKNG